MTTALQIKDVAEATGFSAATLRYYEQIGLLPASARTTAGYRMYDVQAVERLAFIARAKQLGCSLEEIRELVAAWEGGECGPVQDRLRGLVATKIDVARRQIADLTTFVGELERAAESLGRHRPAGACDDGCGCVAGDAVGEPVVAAPVRFGVRP